MKVVLYKRFARSSYHIHAFSSADCAFVPDKGVVLFREQHGSFGGKDYSLTEEERMVNEGKLVVAGKPVDGIEITDIRTLDLKDYDVEDLIDMTHRRNNLEGQVKTKLDDIFGGPRTS